MVFPKNMTLCGRLFILPFLLIVLLASPPLALALAEALAPSGEIEQHLRETIARETDDQGFMCRGQALCTAPLIPLFYERRAFQPGWSGDGRLSDQAAKLVAALENTGREGLRPADYHLYTIKLLLAKLGRLQDEGTPLAPEELVDLDLLLTDAFFLYASHLQNGRINPETIHSQWIAAEQSSDLTVILEEALDSDTIEDALNGLRPPHADYTRLIKALATLTDIAARGGWPVISPGINLYKGMRHRGVYALRQRLMLSGDYHSSPLTHENFFDEKLADAVLRFQYRHGLDVDGIVGPQTLAALNVPVARRIRQIKANIERWRWMPHDLGQRSILVNIADFSLKVIEDGQEVLKSRVVVGKPHRSTPVFSATIEYLVINPYWYLPKTIIVEDVAPNMLANPTYLGAKRIKVFATGGDESQELEPTAINWAAISKENLPYRLRQEPGPLNALGRVKIIFPNKFSVYLHDTPRQELFQKSARDFSSGCIRVEKPVELASYLLGNDDLWSLENIRASMESGVRQVVFLADEIAIHILYQTAWADKEGRIHFRKDIYKRDKVLATALDGLLSTL